MGGLLTRRTNATSVAFAVQGSGAVLVILAALAFRAPGTTVASVGWGAVSGVGTAVGILFLYKGMARGPMSVVVPLSTVGGVVLPVLVGVTLRGERPSASAWVGIALAVPAIALVCAAGRAGTMPGRAAVVAALVSSVGFALQYVALAQAGSAAGLWPVAAGRVASVLTVVLTMMVSIPASKSVPGQQSRPARESAPEPASATARPLMLPPRLALAAAGNGVLAAAGLTLYLSATGQTSMSVAVVLSSLYPVVPVLLGVVVLRERLTRWQVAGLAAAGATVVLVTAG